MSNSSRPHLVILTEDDANKAFAIGFAKHWGIDARRIEVPQPAHGWRNVLRDFEDNYLETIDDKDNRHVLLVIDFDTHYEERIVEALNIIPTDLRPRVFVLGCSDKPEPLASQFKGTKEDLGSLMAQDCVDDTDKIWSHAMLAHNKDELGRLRKAVAGFLFK